MAHNDQGVVFLVMQMAVFYSCLHRDQQVTLVFSLSFVDACDRTRNGDKQDKWSLTII